MFRHALCIYTVGGLADRIDNYHGSSRKNTLLACTCVHAYETKIGYSNHIDFAILDALEAVAFCQVRRCIVLYMYIYSDFYKEGLSVFK